MRKRSARLAAVLLLVATLAAAAGLAAAGRRTGAARAPLEAEPVGRVVRLGAPAPHWVWIGDLLLRRAAIFDGDTGRVLGMTPGGSGIIAPHRSLDGREIYLAETHYARGTRGERTDVVTISDAATLQPVAEVVIPPRRAEHLSWVAASALSDDGRFLAVFNMSPGTSLSIVDVAERRFVGEVETPGCSLVYAAGPRRFLSLCADGTALGVALDAAGREASKMRTARFFDPEKDPISEKGVRCGDQWLFVSREGMVHPIDAAGPELRPGEPWPLLDAGDRADSWRVGGRQEVAAHPASRRLYTLMHRGGPDTHKQPGTEVWVYDLERRVRERRIALRNPVAAFLVAQLDLAPGGFADWLLETLLPHAGVERILVTPDAAPLLLASSTLPATLSVHDAATGAHLRDVREVGVAGSLLQIY